MIQISVFGLFLVTIVVLALVFMLSAGARAGFVNFLIGIGYLIQGVFRAIGRFLGITAAGGMAGILARVFMIMMVALIAFILIVIGIYLLAVAGLIAIGRKVGNEGAVFALIALLIMWGILAFIPAFGPLRPIVWMRRWIVRPSAVVLSVYLVLCLGWWTFSFISPRGHESINRSAGNSAGEFWNGLDKKSLQSEPEMGTFAKLNHDAYATTGGAPFFIRKDTVVKIIDLNGQKSNNRSEGRIKVMIENKYGQYDGGQEGWVPSRVIDWDWKDASREKERKKKEIITVKTTNAWVINGQTWRGTVMPLEKGIYDSSRPLDVYLTSTPDSQIARQNSRFVIRSDTPAVEILVKEEGEFVLTRTPL